MNEHEKKFIELYTKILLCSDCFQDYGLKLQAQKVGIINDNAPCNCCGSTSGKKLSGELVQELASSFFVRGSVSKQKFGAAPRIQFNYSNTGDDFSGFSEFIKKRYEDD